LWLYNIRNNTAISVKGEYDPVFLPMTSLGKKFIFTAYVTQGFSMYSYEEPGAPNLLFRDESHVGLYESAGILNKKSAIEFQFRVMMQSGSSQFKIKDYSYNFKEPLPIAQLDETPYIVCPGLNLSMAIISKNGREVVAYDIDAQKTKVFEIRKGSTCIEKEDLTGIVGKSSFSYDGNLIAYHDLSSWVYNADGYVKIPNSAVVGNIYLFNRKTKKRIPLTGFDKGTAMYPEFLENGDIIFVYYIDGKAEFYRIRPKIQ